MTDPDYKALFRTACTVDDRRVDELVRYDKQVRALKNTIYRAKYLLETGQTSEAHIVLTRALYGPEATSPKYKRARTRA